MRRFLFASFLMLAGLPAFAAERWETLPPTPAPIATLRSGQAKANGISIHYAIYGHGSPLIFLHGGLANTDYWGKQVRAVAAHHTVILMDSRGHGRSTRDARPYGYDLMADDVVALMDVLKIPKADIVGWSDGGIIGLDLAMHHSERVRRLVAIGAIYDVDGLKERPDLNAPIPPVPGFYARNAPDPAHWPALYRKVVTMWATQPHYTIADLGRIKAPVLVMAGEFDVIKRTHTDQLAHAIPDAEEVIIQGGDHDMVLSKPDAVNARILAFLDGPLPQ